MISSTVTAKYAKITFPPPPPPAIKHRHHHHHQFIIAMAYFCNITKNKNSVSCNHNMHITILPTTRNITHFLVTVWSWRVKLLAIWSKHIIIFLIMGIKCKVSIWGNYSGFGWNVLYYIIVLIVQYRVANNLQYHTAVNATEHLWKWIVHELLIPCIFCYGLAC